MALFFTDLGDKSKIQQAIAYMNESLLKISEQEEVLNKTALGAAKKPMKVEPANLMGKLRSIYDYKTLDFNGTELKGKYGYGSNTNNVKRTCTEAKNHADYLFKESTLIHEKNIDAIENNKLVVAAVKSLMGTLGIPNTYTTYDYVGYSGRKTQKKQEHTHSAGYLGDLTRCIKTDDGFSMAESSYKTFLKTIEDYQLKHEREEQEALRKKNQEEQDIADTKTLATLVVKYKLDYQSTWRDVLQEIITHDKYLELGYWLERQRNSWADGFWKAHDGINGFTVETDVDQYIYDEITSLLEDADDGRVFRDCQYNYSTLYGMVDNEDLFGDFRLVFDKIADQLD